MNRYLDNGQLWELRPDVVVGSSEEIDDELQLVDLGPSRKQRFVCKELSENAARWPHVDTEMDNKVRMSV